MKIRFALLLACAAGCGCAQDYALGPDSQVQPGVPQGTVTKHVLPPGRFYPGTPHNYAVYVPAQYKADSPAPVMIFLDGSGRLGNGERVPAVLDNLIAKGDLPAMIGIFVDPGVLPPSMPQAQSRFERVFEYDSLSDRYSRFLLEELIPEVPKAITFRRIRTIARSRASARAPWVHSQRPGTGPTSFTACSASWVRLWP